MSRNRDILINGVRIPFTMDHAESYLMTGGDLISTSSDGIYVNPSVAGDIKVLTLGAYWANNGVIDDSKAITLYSRAAGVWDSTPVMKIYETGTTAVNISYKEVIISPVPVLMDIDGNIYTTIIIGNQEWMVENLRTTKYADGTSIPNLTVNGDWTTDTIGAYCWYDNDIGYKDPYGALYNWYAVDNAHILAPIGWRVPSKIDIETLNTFLGGDLISGEKLKEVGLAHWKNPNLATDEYGFKGLPGGWRNGASGAMTGLTEDMILWSSTLNDAFNSYSFSAFYDETYFLSGSNGNRTGFTVRCMRDI